MNSLRLSVLNLFLKQHKKTKKSIENNLSTDFCYRVNLYFRFYFV